MYLYIYICVCVCKYVYMYLYIYICVCLQICLYVFIQKIYIYIYIFILYMDIYKSMNDMFHSCRMLYCFFEMTGRYSWINKGYKPPKNHCSGGHFFSTFPPTHSGHPTPVGFSICSKFYFFFGTTWVMSPLKRNSL